MLGDAAHLLGIVGETWDTLTVEQEDAYLDWVEGYKEQMAKSARESGRS